jgi:hypothetical protein
MSDNTPHLRYPYEVRLSLWRRVRLAWWVVTKSEMTELRLAKMLMAIHERRSQDD